MSDDISVNTQNNAMYVNGPEIQGEAPPPPMINGTPDVQTSAGGELKKINVGELGNPQVPDSNANRNIPPSDIQTATSNRFFAGNATVVIAAAMQEFISTQKEIGMVETDNAVLGLKTTVAYGESAAAETLAAGKDAATKEIIQGTFSGLTAAMGVGSAVVTFKGISAAEKGVANQIKSGKEAADTADTKATEAAKALKKNTADLDAHKKLLSDETSPKTATGQANVTKDADAAVEPDTFVVSQQQKAAPEMTVEPNADYKPTLDAESKARADQVKQGMDDGTIPLKEDSYEPLPQSLGTPATPAAAPGSPAVAAPGSPAGAPAAPGSTATAAPETEEYKLAKEAFDDSIGSTKKTREKAIKDLEENIAIKENNQKALKSTADEANSEATKARAEYNKMLGEQNITMAQMARGNPHVMRAEAVKGVWDPAMQGLSQGIGSIYTQRQAEHEANATLYQTYKAAQQTGLDSVQEQRKNASGAVDSVIQGWNKAVEDSQVRFQG